MNQSGAVVSRDNFHARGKRGLDFRELLLDAVDDIQRVHAVAHHDNPAHGFSFALPFRHAFADIRPERDRSQVADQHRRAILGRDRHGFQIVQRAQIAEAANHVFGPAHFEQASADFVRAAANFFDDSRERNAVGAKFFGIEIDLILPNEAADGGDFGNARNGLELVAQIPVLKAAQIGQAVLMAVIDKSVFIHPARAGGVRADDRVHAFGQPACEFAAGIPRHASAPNTDPFRPQKRRKRRNLRTSFALARP